MRKNETCVGHHDTAPDKRLDWCNGVLRPDLKRDGSIRAGMAHEDLSAYSFTMPMFFLNNVGGLCDVKLVRVVAIASRRRGLWPTANQQRSETRAQIKGILNEFQHRRFESFPNLVAAGFPCSWFWEWIFFALSRILRFRWVYFKLLNRLSHTCNYIIVFLAMISIRFRVPPTELASCLGLPAITHDPAWYIAMFNTALIPRTYGIIWVSIFRSLVYITQEDTSHAKFFLKTCLAS